VEGQDWIAEKLNKKIESNHVIKLIKSGDKYKNWISTQKITNGDYLSATWDWIRGGERTTPNGDIPIVVLNKNSRRSCFPVVGSFKCTS